MNDDAVAKPNVGIDRDVRIDAAIAAYRDIRTNHAAGSDARAFIDCYPLLNHCALFDRDILRQLRARIDHSACVPGHQQSFLRPEAMRLLAQTPGEAETQ